jgi:histidyl-tRNA synthetase
LEFQINSLGCPACRPVFRKAVVDFLGGREGDLCPDCQRRLRANPLRIYDCKVEGCGAVLRGAPRVLDLLCQACAEQFDRLKAHLDLVGLPYAVNPFIVRGLDYYTRTTFEVMSQDLGAQNAVCGGGRYDALMRELGGPDLPGIGFAIGEERLVSILREKGFEIQRPVALFVASLGEAAARTAFLWVERARGCGLRAEMDFRGASLKAQLRRAGKLGALRVLIIGDAEMASGRAPLKDMAAGTQSEIRLEHLAQLLSQWGEERA